MFELTCPVCGAAMRDYEKHQQWHDSLNITIWKIAQLTGWDLPDEVLASLRESAERVEQTVA